MFYRHFVSPSDYGAIAKIANVDAVDVRHYFLGKSIRDNVFLKIEKAIKKLRKVKRC